LCLTFGPAQPRPKIVAIEGLDGSGKSTFVRGLSEYLRSRGVRVADLRLPSPIARSLPMFDTFRQITAKFDPAKYDPLAMQVFLMADRLHYLASEFPTKCRGADVALFDRYVLSGAAHLLADGFSLAGWFSDLCRLMPRPCASVYLRAGFEVAVSRIRERHDEAEDDFDEERFRALQDASDAVAAASGMMIVDTSQVGLDAYETLFARLVSQLELQP
jgi:dTMP kinase